MGQKRHNIHLKPQYRKEPDYRRLGKLLLELAQAEQERLAQEAHDAGQAASDKRSSERRRSA